LPGHWVASGKPAVGLIENVLSLPLAYHWLTTPGPTPCPKHSGRLCRTRIQPSRSGPEGLGPFPAEHGGHGQPITRPVRVSLLIGTWFRRISLNQNDLRTTGGSLVPNVPPHVAAGQGEKTRLFSGLEVAAAAAHHGPRKGWKAPPFCWALTKCHSRLTLSRLHVKKGVAEVTRLQQLCNAGFLRFQPRQDRRGPGTGRPQGWHRTNVL